jgi:hypothetical protein
MKIWTFIEAHHKDLGVALFILPPALGAMVIAGVGYVASLFLG